MRRGVLAVLAVPLVTGCAVYWGGGLGWQFGESDEYLPTTVEFMVAVSDSVYRECDSDAPTLDSAYHFLQGYLSLDLSEESAEIGMWVEDSNDASPLRRCGSTSTGSGGGTKRPGTFSTASTGGGFSEFDLTFIWSAVPVPDTAGFWVTNTDLSLGTVTTLDADVFRATLTWKGQSMPVLLSLPP